MGDYSLFSTFIRSRRHSGVRSPYYSIGQYWSVLVSSFRIARCGRGCRAFTGNRAIRMAETEPLMQAYYSLVNDVVQRV